MSYDSSGLLFPYKAKTRRRNERSLRAISEAREPDAWARAIYRRTNHPINRDEAMLLGGRIGVPTIYDRPDTDNPLRGWHRGKRGLGTGEGVYTDRVGNGFIYDHAGEEWMVPRVAERWKRRRPRKRVGTTIAFEASKRCGIGSSFLTLARVDNPTHDDA